MGFDWQGSLSFTDRITSITRIQAAYITAKLHDSKSANAEAKRAETDAFALSTSKAEYDAKIKFIVQKAESVSLKQATDLLDAQYDSDVDLLLPKGITIGKYTNAQSFKNGLFSTIYKANAPSPSLRDNTANTSTKIFAVKVTHLSAMEPPHDSKREARLLKVAAGQHVVPLIETFQKAGGQFVLVFPFFAHDLAQLLDGGKMNPSQRQSYVSDILQGLAHVHSVGIVHRDIKPSNILLKSPSGPACIADFGIAWRDGDASSEPADKKILDVGTTCYRPPELLFGNQKYDQSLDMWAVGCVIAQLVSLGRQTLFDSGDLGSDLALVKSIFETLGTPDLTVWPEAANFPDWGKMNFHEYPTKPWSDVLPNASEEAVDLVSKLIVYESGKRLTAEKALKHAYLNKKTSNRMSSRIPLRSRPDHSDNGSLRGS